MNLNRFYFDHNLVLMIALKLEIFFFFLCLWALLLPLQILTHVQRLWSIFVFSLFVSALFHASFFLVVSLYLSAYIFLLPYKARN